MYDNEQLVAADVLKTIARNKEIKRYVQESADLYPLLLAAAKRFVSGETREEALQMADFLYGKGYALSLEYIGENTATEEECWLAKEEFAALIRDTAASGLEAEICFDLSHLGLLINPDFAFQQVMELAHEANSHNLTLMISMEESEKTTGILNIYEKTAELYANVGITIQANLHRSMDDLERLLSLPGKVRLVKGAYKEAPSIALERSEELNQRYLDMLDRLVQSRHPVSIATHDEKLIAAVEERGYVSLPFVEVEMLYGVRPDLSRKLREQGVKTRVYLTYGTEWYLYLCHRLAEHPPNVYLAIADMSSAGRLIVHPY
ncbi:MAG: proline dehydrogenase family protein [Brevibacillus sp.]|nr:proline dehydrogenase family protein [Brevibacillus sp.]